VSCVPVKRRTVVGMDFDPFALGCPSRQVLDRVGDRWTVLVVLALRDGTLRFTQVRDRVQGISEKVLSGLLRGLVRDGLLTRTQQPGIPPRVDYALTPLGEDLAATLGGLDRWAREHAAQMLRARDVYDSASR